MSESLSFCGNTFCSLRVWNLVKAAPEESNNYTDMRNNTNSKTLSCDGKFNINLFHRILKLLFFSQFSYFKGKTGLRLSAYL
jgi:hypothetical protein